MKSMTCEQLYNVWSTDPQLIMILDARPSEDYHSCRIPGSILVEKNHLAEKLSIEVEKLVVVIGKDFLDQKEIDVLSKRQNLIFVKECRRWKELELPLVGTSTSPRSHPFQIGTMGVYPLRTEHDTSFLIVDSISSEACLLGPKDDSETKRLEKLLGIKILYQIQRSNNGIASLECRENPGHFETIELHDGQVLLLGDKALTAIRGPSGNYFVQFEDKAVALGSLAEFKAEDWSRLENFLPLGLVYYKDHHESFSTSLIGSIHSKQAKGA
jgi:rhodanese-related sulfurtransferase